MDAQELRNLQEAYKQVHQVDEDAGIIGGLVGLTLAAKGALHAAKKTKRLKDYPKNYVKGIVDPRTYIPKKKKEEQKEQVDLYDIILSHLLDEGYAETPEAAERIMVHMSEEWRQNIMERDDEPGEEDTNPDVIKHNKSLKNRYGKSRYPSGIAGRSRGRYDINKDPRYGSVDY